LSFDGAIIAVEFSPEEKQIAIASKRKIIIYNLKDF